MTVSRRSEFVVHAGADDLHHEIRRAVERIGSAPGVGDRTKRAGGRESREQVFGLEIPMVGPGVFPAGPDGSTREKFRAGCSADSRRGGAVNVALRVVRLGERDAAGDVTEVAVRGDSDARTHGRQEVGCERLRDGERGYTVAQRVKRVDELGFAVEVIEVAFQPVDQRTGLPVAPGLSATKEI